MNTRNCETKKVLPFLCKWTQESVRQKSSRILARHVCLFFNDLIIMRILCLLRIVTRYIIRNPKLNRRSARCLLMHLRQTGTPLAFTHPSCLVSYFIALQVTNEKTVRQKKKKKRRIRMKWKYTHYLKAGSRLQQMQIHNSFSVFPKETSFGVILTWHKLGCCLYNFSCVYGGACLAQTPFQDKNLPKANIFRYSS